MKIITFLGNNGSLSFKCSLGEILRLKYSTPQKYFKIHYFIDYESSDELLSQYFVDYLQNVV